MPSLFNAVRDLGRLREIAGVLARHGFDGFIRRTGLGTLVPLAGRHSVPEVHVGARIRCALEDLGPSFVKLGQIASTRADLLPQEVVIELRKLQDAVPPVPFEDMRVVLEEQLRRPLDEVFSGFDEEPLASASIGQVYRAQLRQPQGETQPEVVVKIQRPSIAATIERDADLLHWLAQVVERSVPEAALYSPVKMAKEFDRTMRAELDYSQEADNAERFRENFADSTHTRFPAVFREASSRKVLTLEYLPGYNVFDAVAQGTSGEAIARQAIKVMVRMIFEHGFFHADPHPGNLLIDGPHDAPVLGIIDLGQVGRLSPKARDRLVDLMIAVGRNDHRAIATALLNLGRPTKKIDRTAFEGEVAQLTERYVGRRLGDIEASAVLRDLMRGCVRYGIELPTDLMVMVKSLVTVEGIARQIHPELNLAQELRPYLADIVSLRYSPERITSDLLYLANRMSTVAGDFPARAEDILEDLRQGRLRIETLQPNVASELDRSAIRISSAAVEAALILGGSLLITHGLLWAGVAMLGLALTILLYTALRMWVSRGRRAN